MDLLSIAAEIHTHSIKQESMRKQLTESNLKIYKLEEEIKKLKSEFDFKQSIIDEKHKLKEKTERYERTIMKAILLADEMHSEHRDADNVVEDIFQELKKALNE